jgi:glycosyltransferase involved in cell wall biosynthesis
VPERPLRVVHCPAAVGGHAPGLARAERALGADSRAVSFERPRFGVEADELLFESKGVVAREWTRWSFLLRVLRDADVVHFNFGSSIMPRYWPSAHSSGPRAVFGLYARLFGNRDVGWLRHAGKAIFVTYQGDDARTAASLAPLLPERNRAWLAGYYEARDDEAKRRAIANFEKHAHGIYALNPDLLRVLPDRAEFLPYASVDPALWAPARTAVKTRPLVVHAPSDRRAKGTDAIVEAIGRLQSAGVPFEFALVEGVSQHDARALYQRADLVIDQVFAGWYGAVAIEAMALEKPVVAHIRPEDLGAIPEGMRNDLPVIRASAETVGQVLEEWLTRRRHELPELGVRGRAYVERWHDPIAIAARTLEAYQKAVDGAPSQSDRSTPSSTTSAKRSPT